MKLVRDRRKIKDFADIVVKHLEEKTLKLASNRVNLHIYHDDNRFEKVDKSENERSIGSISSADENDCELLTCGNHQHKFEMHKKI
jgi:hypothetical protein